MGEKDPELFCFKSYHLNLYLPPSSSASEDFGYVCLYLQFSVGFLSLIFSEKSKDLYSCGR